MPIIGLYSLHTTWTCLNVRPVNHKRMVTQGHSALGQGPTLAVTYRLLEEMGDKSSPLHSKGSTFTDQEESRSLQTGSAMHRTWCMGWVGWRPARAADGLIGLTLPDPRGD